MFIFAASEKGRGKEGWLWSVACNSSLGMLQLSGRVGVLLRAGYRFVIMIGQYAACKSANMTVFGS